MRQRSIRLILVAEGDVGRTAIEVVGQAGSPAEAAAAARELGPDVFVLNLRLAELGGIEEDLSPQERRVLEQVATGRTNKEIAQVLNLSDKTVKNYLSNAFQKLHVGRRSHAAAVFRQRLQRA